jgi:hypothetical protein
MAYLVALQSWTTMCVKADYTSPVDPMTSEEQTGDEIQEPAIVAPANEQTNLKQEVAPQQKCAMIHDFCLGIPFGMFPTSFVANFSGHSTSTYKQSLFKSFISAATKFVLFTCLLLLSFQS